LTVLTYLGAWKAISAHIRGLLAAAELHAQFFISHNKNPYGIAKTLQVQCGGIIEELKSFHIMYAASIPVPAREAFARFMADGGKQNADNSLGDELLGRAVIIKIAAFEAETTFFFHDAREKLRSACELAFVHLQRLIVVDEDVRAKWKRAFSDGETKCEKLGAVHLLWHGIWAFKVDASGARTDLVFPEPINFENKTVDVGLVLTEWKKATNDTTQIYTEAQKQAAMYSEGVLAGIELVSHRYVVVVTEKYAKPPSDLEIKGVVYRHINIAVDPDSPSIASKKHF
jgi:hypothetical protein